MTLHKSKVTFDDTAEVVVTGKIGGRDIEYRGQINVMTVTVDDGIGEDEYSWRHATWNPEITTYGFEFETIDGKAITAKIGKKPVKKSATVHYQFVIDNRHEVHKCREEVGAPHTADYEIDFDNKQITFTWTEELD